MRASTLRVRPQTHRAATVCDRVWTLLHARDHRRVRAFTRALPRVRVHV